MGFIHEQIILPLSDLLRGEKVSRYLRELHVAESWNKEQTTAFQQDRLRALLRHASKEVPYYREWFGESGLNPDVVEFGQLPVVNKSVMRQCGINQFAAEHFPANQRLVSRSSGSTGEPFTFYESKLSYSVNMAAKLRTWYQAGYQLGNPYVKISYMPRNSWKKRLQDNFNNCIYVDFQSIDDAMMQDVLELLERKKPMFLRSYPLPIYMLARYKQQHPGFSHQMKMVFTTGGTLTQPCRTVIENAFGCKVIDSYSCEGTPNTFQVVGQEGYRVCGYYGIIEVLDNDNVPVLDGVGRIVSTDLWNYAHPFIRYDTQDLAEVHNGQIMRIIGRQTDVLTANDGTFFTTYSFMSFFEHDVEAVDAYQIVKCRDGSVCFKLVVNERYDKGVEQYIVNYWSEKLQFPVKVMVVDEIPMMHNHKHRTIINETSN